MFKYWNGERWVPCSKEQADLIRAQGKRRVIERSTVAAPVAPAELADPAPAVVAPAPSQAFDLSDDELEKLTKPGA
jgi:hypothetical protein